METGPYLIQQLHNDSIGRKQEQSLLYLCACVWGREAEHSTVLSVLTVQEVTSVQEVTFCNRERVGKQEERQ